MQASSQGAKEPRSQAAKELSSQGAKEPRRQAAMEPTKLRNPAPPGQRTAVKVELSSLCRLLVGKWSGSFLLAGTRFGDALRMLKVRFCDLKQFDLID